MVCKEAGWSIFWSIPLLPDAAMVPGDEVFSVYPQRHVSPTVCIPNASPPMFSSTDEEENFLTFLVTHDVPEGESV